MAMHTIALTTYVDEVKKCPHDYSMPKSHLNTCAENGVTGDEDDKYDA